MMRLPWQRGNRHTPVILRTFFPGSMVAVACRCSRCGAELALSLDEFWEARWYGCTALPLPAAPGERAEGLPVPASSGRIG